LRVSDKQVTGIHRQLAESDKTLVGGLVAA
jgi:hypothetical protein